MVGASLNRLMLTDSRPGPDRRHLVGYRQGNVFDTLDLDARAIGVKRHHNHGTFQLGTRAVDNRSAHQLDESIESLVNVFDDDADVRQTAFGQRLALFLRLIGSPISLANIVPSLENGMPVHGFNHLNIRTPDFRRTVEFLRDALGMRVSPVPGLNSTEKAAWILDDSGTAALHLASADVPYSKNEVLPDPPPRGSGAIQHVALTCTDIEAMRAKLRALNLEFRENNPEKGVGQNVREGSERHHVGTQFPRCLSCCEA